MVRFIARARFDQDGVIAGVPLAVEAFRLFTGLEPDVARLHRTFATACAARDQALAETDLVRLGNQRTSR